MGTFGKRLAEVRKEQGMTQKELAEALNTNQSIIGRYETEKVIPSLEVAQKLAIILDTTVGYLLNENAEYNELLQNKKMLNRMKVLNDLDDADKEHAFFLIDAILRDAKARQTFNVKAI